MPLTSEEEEEKFKLIMNKSYLLEKFEKKIGRSARVVFNYIKNLNSYGKNIKRRPASILSTTDKRAILRIASNFSDCILQIKVKAECFRKYFDCSTPDCRCSAYPENETKKPFTKKNDWILLKFK